MPGSLIPYCSLHEYSPYGTTEDEVNSRRFCAQIKSGHIIGVDQVEAKYLYDGASQIQSFLGHNVFFIPMPRSSPLLPDQVWPAREICEALSQKHLCGGYYEVLSRKYPVKKAAYQRTAEDRTTIAEHYDSFAVQNVIIPLRDIVIVDDVLTQGRTASAAYLRISEAFPDHSVRVLSYVRTTNSTFNRYQGLTNSRVGYIRYNPTSGKSMVL